jgi:large subunit ribosomal protein L29
VIAMAKKAKKNTPDDLRAKSADELSDQLLKLKKEQFNLRFQRANGQLEKTNRIRSLRKDIARVETVMSSNRIKAAQQDRK